MDYSSMKVPELKKLLQGRELPVAGNKADLIARLLQDDENKAEGPKAGAGEFLFLLPRFILLSACPRSLVSDSGTT
jgi:SAP domain-containing ribonucleoprotein